MNTGCINLTPRGKHAISAMAILASDQSREPVSLAKIAASGKISISYLEQIFVGLRRGKLVKSYRGPGGGYTLAKPADEISIADILEFVGESSGRGGNTQEFWQRIGRYLYGCLKDVTLADVLSKKI